MKRNEKQPQQMEGVIEMGDQEEVYAIDNSEQEANDDDNENHRLNFLGEEDEPFGSSDSNELVFLKSIFKTRDPSKLTTEWTGGQKSIGARPK